MLASAIFELVQNVCVVPDVPVDLLVRYILQTSEGTVALGFGLLGSLEHGIDIRELFINKSCWSLDCVS